ncbi:BPSS1187 family protein [Gloeobacter morelensis]|uniref:Uncharacterized protein n=1 Tax=Gloeobacter morelensis MG652769 TaxID=2781736 RepID=A0ABY3PIA7_9CYAN|nr:hypothetical protein [Gloeobacter morelensis]UFP93267.1 hypothetical protein ISF26_15855 [Gloeobacter morelensis MG652769]
MNIRTCFASLVGAVLACSLQSMSAQAATALCPSGAHAQHDTAAGVVCVIQPSLTDPEVADRGTTNLGYGYHVVGLPTDIAAARGVFFYLMGTNGKPYDPVSQSLPSLSIVEEGIAQGFVVLQLAYPNDVAVADLCGNDGECYGPARQEIIYGSPVSAAVEIPPEQSIMHRLSALVAYLKANMPDGVVMPQAIRGAAIDWQAMRLGGSSQGGGHAGYIAHDYPTEGVCFLASPVDTVAVTTESTTRYSAVDWIAQEGWQTPAERLKGVVHRQDGSYESITTNFRALGLRRSTSTLTPNNDWLAVNIPTNKPHTSPANHRDLVDARAWACFASEDSL